MEPNIIKTKLIDMLTKLYPNSDVDTDVLGYVDLIDDFGMDSITFISIVIEIEAVFDIVIPDDSLLMENFRCVDSIIGIVENAMYTIDECVAEKERT